VTDANFTECDKKSHHLRHSDAVRSTETNWRHCVLLVTGGAGFIGSNFVHEWISNRGTPVLVVDKLTYAGNLENLSRYQGQTQVEIVQADICDRQLIGQLLKQHRPEALVHFAAESHVDRSIHGPDDFVRTNINGTFELLEATRAYWNELEGEARSCFRFLHVSTDEVYGTLGNLDPAARELAPYAPNSPYAASKAASDQLVRAWHKTYGLPVLTTTCSNNYGPYQFPEKLIPLMVLSALEGKPLPIYGDGLHMRNWLYVADHCHAIQRVLARGRPGETYNICGKHELRNIDVVRVLCQILDELRPRSRNSYAEQIIFVPDRAGHDRRYAIDPSKIQSELGWYPSETFATGIRKTVQWYLDNPEWVSNVRRRVEGIQ
jgi:dTDP-glucose 4,6-dehydratase